MSDNSTADLRAAARSAFDHAAPAVIAAFNLADSRDWQFPPNVQARALELVRELCFLFFENEQRISRSAFGAARDDPSFQSFIAKIQARPKRRKGNGHAQDTDHRCRRSRLKFKTGL